MIKNIIFDVGNVLADFRYRAYMRDLGFSEELVDFFSDNMVMTDYWRGLDLGIEDEDEAPGHFTRLFPEYEKEIRLFWENIADIVEEYDYSERLVIDVKESGYKVYALSNYPDKLSDMHWKYFRFLPHMDGKIISGKEHICKPSPEIYRMLEMRFGLKLDECLFIDDSQANIDAAASLGMDTILFTGIDNLRSELKRKGIL